LFERLIHRSADSAFADQALAQIAEKGHRLEA
jgi:hypothetical protein